MCYVFFMNANKMREFPAIILVAKSDGDLCYVAEKKRFRFLVVKADPPPEAPEFGFGICIRKRC